VSTLSISKRCADDHRFLADGIFLGLLFHQFVHWWSFSRGEDRLIVRLLVVSPALSEWRSVLVIITFSTLADITVLLDDLQCRYISIVSALFLQSSKR
jgi:hypothetical protein